MEHGIGPLSTFVQVNVTIRNSWRIWSLQKHSSEKKEENWTVHLEAKYLQKYLQ